MSQTDEQIRPTLDALVERLRTSVSDQVSVAAEQLRTSVEAARSAAVQDAVQQAVVAAERAVTARLTDAFTRRDEQIKETARAEWFAVGMEQARGEAAVAAAVRDAEVRAAAAERDAQLQASAEAAEKATAALAARLEAAASEHREETARLLRAVRLIDDATSLSQALEALGAAAKAEADRFAVLLPKGDALRAWSHAGFPALDAVPSPDIPLPEAGVAADTLGTGRACQAEPGGSGRPHFAGVPATDSATAFVAVPVTMNGQVIAVLCGEQVDGQGGSERLFSVFEILARHTARVLETLTALRLAQLGSHVSQVVAAPPPQ